LSWTGFLQGYFLEEDGWCWTINPETKQIPLTFEICGAETLTTNSTDALVYDYVINLSEGTTIDQATLYEIFLVDSLNCGIDSFKVTSDVDGSAISANTQKSV
jgi:hypothetical protein